jgi:hypothetical protein
MGHLRCWIPALSAVLITVPPLGAATPSPCVADKDSLDDARTLAARIDEHLAAGWQKVQVLPAPPTDDAAFLRRLSLDVVGRIPTVADVRAFLADRRADKRKQLINRFLDSPGYVNHFTNVWRDLLLSEPNADFQQRFYRNNIERWLRDRFAQNVPYDRMVRELLTVPLKSGREAVQEVQQIYRGDAASPLVFFLSKQARPENLAASTARVFLGVRLECAQCHNHPFGRWTREQFWSQAAFFAGLRAQGNDGFYQSLGELADRRELTIPNTERVAQARFLDGGEPQWRFQVGARSTLADWMTAADNPFFARAAVNRLWAHFFGIGFVEPVDDFNDENAPSHPELLDELARAFAGHGFDYKFLIRAVTLSKAYQLGSVYPSPNPPNPRLFARMPVKGLSQDQLFASLAEAVRLPAALANPRRLGINTPQAEFVAKFGTQEKPIEYQSSIPQALALMNSRLVGDATDLTRSEFLAAVASAPFLDTAGRVETLYLATLSRPPRADESARLIPYVDRGGVTRDPRAALADVFWALLNSTEFRFNH